MSTSNTITKTDLQNIINAIFPATTEDMTQAQIDAFVASLNYSGVHAVDCVVEEGTSEDWKYRKWNSGRFDAWYKGTVTQAITSSAGNVYMASSTASILGPSAIKISSTNDVDCVYVSAYTSSYTVWTATFSASKESDSKFSFTFRLCSGSSRTSTDYTVRAYVSGIYTS